jgi:DNA modification methylase
VPFAGSGTECVSASRNGRDFWAAELNPEYVRLAESRLSAQYEDAQRIAL